MDRGDIHLADLHEKQQRRVLIVSTARFHQLSGRAMIVPELGGPPDEVADPWRITIDGRIFGIDHLASLSVDRVLGRVDRAPADAVLAVRRALLAIT